MLLKPTMAVPHGGGKRFDSNSLEYKVLSGWIAEGMPPPRDDDPQVTALEVFPAAVRLATGAEQQLVVRARYSDGNVRDITRWVKFSSSDEGVASVDDLGHVKMNGNGEAAITLWYSSRVLYSRVSVPYPNKIDAAVYEKFPRHNYIDDLVLDKLEDPEHRAFGNGGRFHVHSARVSGCRRHSAHLRRSRGFPGRQIARQTREAD